MVNGQPTCECQKGYEKDSNDSCAGNIYQAHMTILSLGRESSFSTSTALNGIYKNARARVRDLYWFNMQHLLLNY